MKEEIFKRILFYLSKNASNKNCFKITNSFRVISSFLQMRLVSTMLSAVLSIKSDLDSITRM